jgi:glycosyltransferase involved in cell wall biosynthesis
VRSLIRALRKATPDVIVVAHVADVERAVNRVRLQSSLSPRVVVSAHALQPEFFASMADNASFIDAVVCTNRLTCAAVKAFTPISTDRIYYAPYGVELVTAKRSSTEADDKLHIAYVGRLDRTQKRVQDIIEMATVLEERGVSYELSVAGAGPDEEWLRSRLPREVIDGRIKFLGHLAASDVRETVYNLADALLIPSLWETGPIVAWEAMACGVPVVTSAYIGSALESSLENERNCLMFPIGDATAAVNCLERLRDPSLRHEIIVNGINLVRERYSIGASVRHWNSCLRAIMKRPPRPATQIALEHTMPAGRLDHLFRVRVGEKIREMLRLQYEHDSPGGEWPHAQQRRNFDEDFFWKTIMSLDHTAVESGTPFGREQNTV